MDVISTTWQGSEGSTGLWMILWRWPVGIGQAQNFSCQLSSTNTCRMYAEMPVIEHSYGSFPWPCEDICEITRGYLPNFVCSSVPPIGSATTSLLMTLTCILKHSAKTFTTKPSWLRRLREGQKIMKHMFRSPEHHAVEKRKSLCRCSHFRYSPVPSPIDFKPASSRSHFFEYATDGLYCSVSQAEEKTPVQWVPSGNQTWHGLENLLSCPIWFYDFLTCSYVFSV